MHSEEMLDTASRLIFEVTGKDLNNLQSDLLKASWENYTYDYFAQKYQYSSDYVKDIGSNLWKLFSQALGKTVNKKNFRQLLQQYHYSQQQRLYSEILSKRDVLTLPDVSLFFGRGEERDILQRWILEDNCRLVALLGMGGVGKTTLAAKLLEDVQDKFDYVIWRSLSNAPRLNNLLQELVLFLSDQQETKADIKALLRCLHNARCLVVLDNVETILRPGELAGEYCYGYEDYGELFRQVGEINHGSCVVITSREEPVEVAELSGVELPVRYLRVCGSEEATQGLISAKGLSGSGTSKRNLCESYAYNPLAIKIVATSIQELFDGEIEHFLNQDTRIFKGIRRLLNQQFDRLSPSEQIIMYWLSINRSWTSINELREDISPGLSRHTLLEALESLCYRSLIEKQSGRYTQQPVVMEYVTNRLIERIVGEVVSPKGLHGVNALRVLNSPFRNQKQLSLFTSYPLIKTTSQDYIKEGQIRLILEPVAQKIRENLGCKTNISKCIYDILQVLREKPSSFNNYGVGNLINLASHLHIDLSCFDFSHLEIWHADLKNTELHNVNFTQAHFHKSDFARTIFGIHCVAINPNGELIATGETCQDIHIWRLIDNQQLMTLQGHADWVQSVVFSPRNQILASASFDTTIKLWDIKTGKCLRTLQGHHAPVMSVIFIPFASLNSDPIEKQDLEQEFEDCEKYKKYILLSCSFDGTIKLWDIDTGGCLKTLYGHTQEVYCISYSQNSNLLASGSVDKTIKLWNISTGECVKTLFGHKDKIWSVQFTSNGKTLVSSSADTTIKLWNVSTGVDIKTLEGHTAEVTSIQLSKDNQTLASSSRDTTIRLWDIKTGKNIRTFTGSKSWVWSVIFSPNSQHLITGGYDFNVNFWEVETGRCWKKIQGNYKQTYGVAFSHDGKLLANSYWLSDNSIKIWDVRNGKCIKILQGHTNWVTCVAFSPDNKLIASGCFDRTIKIWDVSTGRCLKTMQGHHGELTSIIFAPNGKFIFSSSIDKTIKAWNIDTGEIIRDLKEHSDWVHSLSLNYANKSTANILASGGIDQNVKLWNINTGELIKVLKGHTGWVFSVAFHPQGKILASGSHDGTIRLFNIENGYCINILKSESTRVYSVAFNPQGNILVSGQNDGTLKVWDVDTGECLRVLHSSNHEIWSLAFSPVDVTSPKKSKSFLACPGYDEVVNFWDLEIGEIIKTLQPKKLYEYMNITGAKGLTYAQKKTLVSLGAVNTATT